MPSPTLSTLERQRIEAAAKLAASGAKVQWRNVGRRIWYVVDGKPHPVTSAPTDRVWVELTRLVRGEFYAETQRLAEARGTSKKAEEGRGQALDGMEVGTVSPLGGLNALPDLHEQGYASGPHGEERGAVQGV